MKSILFSIALTLGVNTSAFAGVDEGVADFKAGNYAQALAEFQPLADQGDPHAQYDVGIMYQQGYGVPQDATQAANWYRKAAEQGDARAQHNLALLYDNGNGVPQDTAQAANWYRKAALRGNASAQFYLAHLYGKGDGVPQDATQAANWYRKAASQKFAKAQYILGLAYLTGSGVPENHVAGYALIALAVANKDESIDPEIVKKIGIIAKGTTSDEIEAAQDLMREMSLPMNFLKALDTYVKEHT